MSESKEILTVYEQPGVLPAVRRIWRTVVGHPCAAPVALTVKRFVSPIVLMASAPVDFAKIYVKDFSFLGPAAAAVGACGGPSFCSLAGVSGIFSSFQAALPYIAGGAVVTTLGAPLIVGAVSIGVGALFGVFNAVGGLVEGTVKAGRHLLLGPEAPSAPSEPALNVAPHPEKSPSFFARLRLPKIQVTETVNGCLVKGYGPHVQVVTDAARVIAQEMMPFEETGYPDIGARKAVRAELDKVTKALSKLYITDMAGRRQQDVPFFCNVRNRETGELEKHILLPVPKPVHASSIPYREYVEITREEEVTPQARPQAPAPGR